MLLSGLGLAVLEVSFITGLLIADGSAGLRILSMIVAGHLGGRLAFIGAGFEAGFTALLVTGIVTFHNCTMLMLVYPLCVLLSERLERLSFFASLREKVRLGQSMRSRWNLMGIAVFIWVPLPMTGAVAGGLLAHFEGYKPAQVLSVTLGAMIVGVVSWTLAFDYLYAWMRGIGPYVTTVVTLLLVLLPIVLNTLRRKKSAPTVSYRTWPSPKN